MADYFFLHLWTSLFFHVMITKESLYKIDIKLMRKNMRQEERKSEKLIYTGLKLLSFIPVFNWISLICIGKRYKSRISIICGIMYGIFTFMFPEIAVYLWIIVIVQYGIVRRKMKKFIFRQDTIEVQKVILNEEILSQNLVLNKESQKEIVDKKWDIQSSENNNDMFFDDGYIDIVLDGEEEKRQVIPFRISEAVLPKENIEDIESKSLEVSQSVPIENEVVIDFSTAYSRYSPNSRFIDDMKKFVAKVGKKVSFVPFMEYWPTYDSMNKQQQEWYFYWRTEVRNGNYLDTDLSYIFIHVYELLSGYGWKDEKNGYEQLRMLWLNYREKFPKLDNYLFSWTFEFAQFYKLEFFIPEIPEIQLPYQLAIRDILIEQHSTDIPLKLPFSLINALCDYSVVNSKFYKDGHQLLMQEAIPRVIALVDAALIKKKKRGILALYGPNRTKKQSYYMFQSAVCPNANKKIDVSIKAYTTSQKLRSYINEIVRYGENILRRLYNCRGRLRGVTLDEEMASLIEGFLEKEYNPNKQKNNIIEQKVEVKLDFGSIDELRTQSNTVRDILAVSEDGEEKKKALTDLQEVKAFFAELSLKEKELMDTLYNKKWECVLVSEMLDTVNGINKVANKYLARELIIQEDKYLIVEDDYRDELEYIYINLPITSNVENQISAQDKKHFNTLECGDGIQPFIETLSKIHKEVVYIILSQEENVQILIEQIAEEEMTMSEILIDEINDKATQFLDDVLIDTLSGYPCILEQYQSELKEVLLEGGGK